MSTFTFNNEKYVLKPVICEGRQLSVICDVEAVLEGFGRFFLLDLLHTAHSDSQYLFLYGRIRGTVHY